VCFTVLYSLLNKASEAAIKAANAYKNIVTSISEAKKHGLEGHPASESLYFVKV